MFILPGKDYCTVFVFGLTTAEIFPAQANDIVILVT